MKRGIGLKQLQLKYLMLANFAKTNHRVNTMVGLFLGMGREHCK